MKRWTRTQGWQGLRALIAGRESWSNSTGTFRGGRYFGRDLPHGHQLSSEFATIFRHDLVLARAHGVHIYVIWSYQTPIMWRTWHPAGYATWHDPNTTYSVTTSKHQGAARTAVSMLQRVDK